MSQHLRCTLKDWPCYGTDSSKKHGREKSRQQSFNGYLTMGNMQSLLKIFPFFFNCLANLLQMNHMFYNIYLMKWFIEPREEKLPVSRAPCLDTDPTSKEFIFNERSKLTVYLYIFIFWVLSFCVSACIRGFVVCFLTEKGTELVMCRLLAISSEQLWAWTLVLPPFPLGTALLFAFFSFLSLSPFLLYIYLPAHLLRDPILHCQYY